MPVACHQRALALLGRLQPLPGSGDTAARTTQCYGHGGRVQGAGRQERKASTTCRVVQPRRHGCWHGRTLPGRVAGSRRCAGEASRCRSFAAPLPLSCWLAERRVIKLWVCEKHRREDRSTGAASCGRRRRPAWRRDARCRCVDRAAAQLTKCSISTRGWYALNCCPG